MSDKEKDTEVPEVEGTGLRHSDEIEKIAGALAKVQGAVQDPKRVGKNPHFGSHYATLEEIIKSARPVLVEHGVTMIQAPSMEDNLVSVETMLVHESGQWFRNRASAPMQKADPQGVGSAITYLRRYSLSAMLGLAQEDDDGNAASSRKSVNGDRSAPEHLDDARKATKKQLGFIRGLMKDKAIPEEHLERLKARLDEGMSKEQASKAIEWLQERPDAEDEPDAPEPGEPLSDKQVVEKARADWITYWESVHGEGTTGERLAWEAERLDPHLLKDEDTPDHSRLDEEDYGMLVEKLADEESQTEMEVGA